MSKVTGSVDAIARVVRERRKAFRLTQAQLAGLAGVSPKFVFVLEKGKESVALDKLILVLNTLGLELDVKVINRG